MSPSTKPRAEAITGGGDAETTTSPLAAVIDLSNDQEESLEKCSSDDDPHASSETTPTNPMRRTAAAAAAAADADDGSVQPNTTFLVERRILDLIDQYPSLKAADGQHYFLLDILQARYQMHFKEELNSTKFGYKSIKELLSHLSNILLVKKSPYCGLVEYEYICRKGALKQSSSSDSVSSKEIVESTHSNLQPADNNDGQNKRDPFPENNGMQSTSKITSSINPELSQNGINILAQSSVEIPGGGSYQPIAIIDKAGARDHNNEESDSPLKPPDDATNNNNISQPVVAATTQLTASAEPPSKRRRGCDPRVSNPTHKNPPDDLKRYVRRCLQRCANPEQVKVVQQETENMIANALRANTLYSTDWDSVRLIDVPNQSLIHYAAASQETATTTTASMSRENTSTSPAQPTASAKHKQSSEALTNRAPEFDSPQQEHYDNVNDDIPPAEKDEERVEDIIPLNYDSNANADDHVLKSAAANNINKRDIDELLWEESPTIARADKKKNSPASSTTCLPSSKAAQLQELKTKKDRLVSKVHELKSRLEKFVVEKFVFTTHYQELMKHLQHNPNGLSWKDIDALIRGIKEYLKTAGKDYNVDRIPPTSILRECTSIEEVKRDDGNFFYRLPQSLQQLIPPVRGTSTAMSLPPRASAVPPQHNRRRFSDSHAALEFLNILKKEYRHEREWPRTTKELKAFVIHRSETFPSSIKSWMNAIKNPEGKVSYLRKQVVSRLVRQWKNKGKSDFRCVKDNSGRLEWDFRRVHELLEKSELERRSNDTGLSSTGCQHGNQQEATPARYQQQSAGEAPSSPPKAPGCVHGTRAPVQLIETMEQLYKARDEIIPSRKRKVAVLDVDKGGEQECEIGMDNSEKVVAIDCEGIPDNLYLLQVGTGTTTYLFDCIKLNPQTVCQILKSLFTDRHIIKLFHDIHKDAAALASIGGLAEPLRGTLDTQLAMESLTGEVHMGINQMLEHLGQPVHESKQAFRERARESANAGNGSLFRGRPLPIDAITYAADDVDLVVKAKDALFEALQKDTGDPWKSVQAASDARAAAAIQNGGSRQLGFDVSNSYAMASFELLEAHRPGDLLVPIPLRISNDAPMLIDLLPQDLTGSLLEENKQAQLSDIVLDKGRRPLVWVNGARELLGNKDRVVTTDDIVAITAKLGGFGGDNRAGLERQLHRVSAMRNRQNEIIGLTLRVGRHVTGNAAMISDLLFANPQKSILFLGEPGSGKTTIIREVTRLLSEHSNVCIVDTSNEIAGDGDVPHPCVGFARRLMVPSLDEQSAIMIECVQNHTPEVMVVDEIGRPSEVDAARTCRQRGVRLIASAHGDMRKLIKNTNLCDLVGGVESVTLGDSAAKAEAARRKKYNGGIDNGGGMGTKGGSLQKLKATRKSSPTFDIIVELRRGAHNEWRLVLDTADAVDRILEGRQYLAQKRTRDPATGRVQYELEQA